MTQIEKSERIAIAILLAIAILIGIIIVDDYGISWDEPPIYAYGNYALESYKFILSPKELPVFFNNLNLYGPAYFMVATALSRLILLLIPSWSTIEASHLISFFSFLVGSIILYLLSRQWISRLAAGGATLLFISQPLLWGHAFINPKDIPFMTFFMASTYLGFCMIETRSNTKWIKFLVAGLVLGLTTSIRIIGPLAGLIVAVYSIIKYPSVKTFVTLLSYYLLAGVTVYLTWPYLWKAPGANFLESLRTMSNFPVGEALFMGNIYPTNQLPLRYFPTLLSIQLTEPVLILASVGAFFAFRYYKNTSFREPAIMFIFWFIFPALWIVLSNSPLYDNSRQLFFLWPPLFILSGIGIDWLISILKPSILKQIFLLAIAVPGIVAGIQLHPYEYIYYNSTIGGVQGAYRNYDLDYWGTSYKEAMEYINQNAPEGTQVIVWGSRPLAKIYARSDLIVIGPSKLEKKNTNYYFSLCLTRNNNDQERWFCRRGELVFTVERFGSALSYVRKHIP